MKRSCAPNRTGVYKFERVEYRRYFKSEQEYLDAMERADTLEKKGLKNRAWRVRLNLDIKKPTD